MKSRLDSRSELAALPAVLASISALRGLKSLRSRPWARIRRLTGIFSVAVSLVISPLMPLTWAGPPFTEFVDPHPAAGNQFGLTVVALSTGNVVITSPYDDAGGTDAGAVYLFNGATGALISTITGSHANDRIGYVNTIGASGVTALSNGNFVISSQTWNSSRGAVTWGSGTTGVSGTVSSSNSLVGSTINDGVFFVTALTNGNYVVSSPNWDNGANFNAGAATWGNGLTGVSGTISSANSLIGSFSGDQLSLSNVSFGGVTALTNGNYVVCSPNLNPGGKTAAGAATWGNGSTGTTGVVSVLNSLVGGRFNEKVCNDGVTALTNGNYVVSSPFWTNGGAAVSLGAATWGNGSSGTVGVVSVSNSLHGSKASDFVGGKITPLTNGNYVVSGGSWDNGSTTNVGHATWGDGATGIVGPVTTSNSLYGASSDDQLANYVTPLANGNYVVVSPFWDNGGVADAGAATWGNGTTGVVGPVTSANSLVGSSTEDNVGRGGALALTNGNYVVPSPDWDNGGLVDAGAATWGNGASGITGAITASNSLVGSKANDAVANDGATVGIIALTNGNYVVKSANWDNGSVVDAGAATWGSGTSGITGAISASNSLVGSTTSDGVSGGGTINAVVALTNGNYVVVSQYRDSGGLADVGGATWGNGATGITGTVTSANSLAGIKANDQVGDLGVTALPNGNYVVTSQVWDNGATVNAGAATWGSGTSGISGSVSSLNSLVGSVATSNLQAPVVADAVNGTFLATFLTDGGGRVRVGSLVDGIAPTLAASSSSNLTASTADLSGNVTSDNGSAVTARGFVYSTTAANADPRLGGTGVIDAPQSGTTGPMSATLTGLAAGTSYSFRAYATNGAGTAYSAAATFTPVAFAPTIASPTSTGVNYKAAILGGTVSADGGAPVTERGVVYSLTAMNAFPFVGGTDVTKIVASGTTGTFTAAATGLTAGSSYSYKAFATNVVGTSYTSIGTFTTGPAPTQITVNAGSGQTAVAGSAVAIAPSVIVRDASNNPVGDVTVTFAVASGGGSLTGGTQTTNASGIATVGGWTLGPIAGLNSLTATSSGLAGSPVAFTATGTATPFLKVGDSSATEGNSGSQAFSFAVTLSSASASTVTVSYATLDGTATSGSDYTSASGLLTFAPGETSKPVAITVSGDTTPESNEGFALVLSGPAHATLGRSTGLGTIRDDDRVATPTEPVRPQSSWQEFFAVDSLETPYVGDFNGDLKTDIITFTRQNPNAIGDVYVALSDGAKFGANTKWHDFFAISTDEAVVIGDYNGDGKADIATWLLKTSRQVYVALSTGTGMLAESAWVSSIGTDATDLLFSGDANGDGKDDLIAFARKEGKVYAALSDGTKFGTPTVWHGFFAVSTYERPRVADVNGDGKADIVTFATDSPTAFGDVYVATSDGTQFVGPTGAPNDSSKWHDFFAIRPTEEIRIGDLSGDGKDDFFTFLPAPFAQCYSVLSQGASMAENVLWAEAVAPLLGAGDNVYVGDVNGDGKGDIIIFAQKEGKVFVSLAP